MALYRISTFDTYAHKFIGSEQRKRIDAAVCVARDMLYDSAKASAALDSKKHLLNMQWVMRCFDRHAPLSLAVGSQVNRYICGKRIRIVREA